MRSPSGTGANIGVFQPAGDDKKALTGAVKAAFDPDRLLNRDRMFEGV
jgi:FAD/FMN-containing dehydrogenase